MSSLYRYLNSCDAAGWGLLFAVLHFLPLDGDMLLQMKDKNTDKLPAHHTSPELKNQFIQSYSNPVCVDGQFACIKCLQILSDYIYSTALVKSAESPAFLNYFLSATC